MIKQFCGLLNNFIAQISACFTTNMVNNSKKQTDSVHFLRKRQGILFTLSYFNKIVTSLCKPILNNSTIKLSSHTSSSILWIRCAQELSTTCT